jgi:hypothetical protein
MRSVTLRSKWRFPSAVHQLDDFDFAGNDGVQRTFHTFMHGEFPGSQLQVGGCLLENSGIARTSSAVSMIRFGVGNCGPYSLPSHF